MPSRWRRFVAEQGIAELVVGLPLEARGSHGTMAEAATAWAEAIGDALALPVTLRDERLSSHLAEVSTGPDASRPLRRTAIANPAGQVS